LAEDENGELIALKVMKKYPKNDKGKHWDLFYNEIKAMKNLKHSNILKLLNYSEDSVVIKPDGSSVKVIYIALEYADYGELFDFIAETGRFTEEEARYYFHQLISAIEYMHRLGYAHRDVKPENLLVDKDFNLKLADFGFATKENFSSSRKGTFGYMSPQVIANQEYNCKEADLFSAAVLLFIMVTQHPPFLRAEQTDKYYKRIYEGNWESFWSVHSDENLSETFIDFITRMFSVDPNDRLTIKEIKSHPWFNGSVPTQREIYKRFSKRKVSLDEYFDNKENQHKNEIKARTKSSPKQNNKLYTQFYEVNDGDELLNILVDYANKEEYE